MLHFMCHNNQYIPPFQHSAALQGAPPRLTIPASVLGPKVGAREPGGRPTWTSGPAHGTVAGPGQTTLKERAPPSWSCTFPSVAVRAGAVAAATPATARNATIGCMPMQKVPRKSTTKNSASSVFFMGGTKNIFHKTDLSAPSPSDPDATTASQS
jgi:hypothetical protein